MLQIFNYCGFGLNISSEIEFPELMEASFEKTDLFIRFGTIPASLFSDNNLTNSFSIFEEDTFLLNLPGIAKYHATNGMNIIVEPYPNAIEGSIRLFLLSITMAAILSQKQKILLHTSAILRNGKLSLFLGESGAGKSSIAAELSKRGYILFADDICVLEFTEGNDDPLLAYSSYPMMKLWEETVHELDDVKFDKSHRIIPKFAKYGQFFHEKFSTQAFPIDKIFILNPVDKDDENYNIRKINGVEAFEILSRNTYRSQFIQKSDLQMIHFRIISYLAQNTTVTELSRSKSNSRIDSFTDFVETYLEKI
jgi:hypothetical protein